MEDFTTFLKNHKTQIQKFANENTPKNEHGIPVITKDDEWRDIDEEIEITESLFYDDEEYINSLLKENT